MTMSKKIISVILVITLMATTFCMSGLSAFAADTDANASGADSAQSTASQEIDEKYDATGEELGAIYTPQSTKFRVWAPMASKVVVNLFATGSDSEDGAKNLGSHDLAKVGEGDQFKGVWEATVQGDQKNVYYTYSITTTDVTGKNETTHETQDVYSKAVGVNGNRSMVVDLDSTDPKGWENDGHIYLKENTDASVWEVHVKDFSYNPNSGVSEANRGKYLAFTETGTTLNGEGNVATCVDYLKELGITSVHINPFYDFGSVEETGDNSLFNWGYDPKNYNVPEGSYSSNPYDGNVRINECKQMIMALHKAGIQVIMDVVYNHTQNTNSSFQYTVPGYYYRYQTDGTFSSGSGCGNDTASEHKMYGQFMVDSVTYWADEYHVDGFRFDLMGLHDVETMNNIRASLDKLDDGKGKDLIMYGEAWTMSTSADSGTVLATQSNISKMSERIADFNDQIRDGIKGSVFDKTGKGFIQGQKSSASAIVKGVNANTKGGNWKPTAPSQCVTYASCHDNATLYDRLVYSVKGATADFTQRYNDLIEMNKLSAAIEMTSQGINFMLAGEEMGRTKQGDENSYSSPATLNMLNWEQLVTNGDLVSYYKGLLKIRKAFSPFTDATMGSSENYSFSSTSSNVISYTVSNNTEGEWSKIAVIYNSGLTETTATLKDTSVANWVIVANDREAGLSKLGEVAGSTFTLPASSAIIAVDKESFEKVNLKDNLGKVLVKHIFEETGEVISEYTIKGTVGSSYKTLEDPTVDIIYSPNKIEGNPIGKYAEQPQEVVYKYSIYVPEAILKADLNSDGNVDIKDVTTLQLYLAHFNKFTDEQIALSDVTYDNHVDINDGTMIQLYLANFSVGVGQVEVNYYNDETGEKMAESDIIKGKVGTDYLTKPKVVIGYAAINEKNPDNATGKFSYGHTAVINYYYSYIGQHQTLHIKYADGVTDQKNLNVWAWQTNVPQNDGSLGEVNLCKNDSWPGDALSTEKDAAGWMKYEVESPGTGTFCFILSGQGGTPQSNDYKGYTQNELWVIVNNMEDHTNFMDVYDVDPIANSDAKPLRVTN